MASCKLMSTKDGRRFWKISVSRGHGKSPYTTRFYWKDGWSERYALREMKKAAAEFERKCSAGEIMNRAQLQEQKRIEAAEAAKLKTVKQYATGVYMPTKLQTISEGTRKSYQTTLDRHIFPVIGDMLLPDVTPAILQKLLIDFQANHAHGTTLVLYNVLNGIFEMAFLDDSIPISPMLKVKRPSISKDERAKRQEANKNKAYTAAEMKYILSCAENEPIKWQTFITLAADTGARRGELCGLCWTDINWAEKTITIQRNVQHTKKAGTYVTSTKTGNARTVDVGESSLRLLKQLRMQQAETGISKYVFTLLRSAGPMNPQRASDYFAKFGKQYGIDGFHPHKLRHTAASIAVTSGADIVSVSARLGHANPSTTLKMYAHANDEGIRRAGDIVREALKAGNE